MGRVVIGMDPHKRSAMIEIIDEQEQVLDQYRYGTDTDGYQQMLTAGRRFPERVWAVEGCAGIGRHIAQRPGCGCSTPDRAAKQTPSTPTAGRRRAAQP